MKMITKLGVGMMSAGSSPPNSIVKKGQDGFYLDLCQRLHVGWRVAWWLLGKGEPSGNVITNANTTHFIENNNNNNNK